MTFTRADYRQAADVIRSRSAIQPAVGLVLGSGLKNLANALDEPVVIPYEAMRGWPLCTAEGHVSELVIGWLEGQPVMAGKGRAHFYEGYTLDEITFSIRVMHELGVGTVILTNAAGGINPAYDVGDLMLVNDHINFVGMAGHNPLIGPNDPTLGERFVGMAQTYDRELRRLARQVAAESGITLHEGVYVCLSGPSYETPAEIRMLRLLGADAVGMSTVHEVLVARHMGMRVMAISGITNRTIDSIDTDRETTSGEVLDAGEILRPRLETVLRGVLRSLAV